MINQKDFTNRLQQIMEHYELSATALADRIAVQRSSISHILSGRNKPSLDFVLKVVQNFPEVNLYWLLNGKGNFPTEVRNPASPPLPQISLPTDRSRISKIVIFYEDGCFEFFEQKSK